MAELSKIVNVDGGIKGVVDDGTRAIPIENKFGKPICTIYVRPGDFSIIDRYNDVIRALPDIVEPLKQLSIENDGTAKLDDEWKVIKQVEVELYKQINYLFDMEEAEKIFEKRNPFSSVNGVFFCETIISLIGDIISENVVKEAEKVQIRTEKYLDDLPQQPTAEVTDNAGTITNFPTGGGEAI